MLRVPKKLKFKKARKGRLSAISKGGNSVDFGEYGLKALTAERVNSRQVEAARRVIVTGVRKDGKLWIKIFTDIPVSKKPNEVRMGKGKGSVEYYVSRVSPGRVLFEIGGVSKEVAFNLLCKAARKLPVKCKVVERYEW